MAPADSWSTEPLLEQRTTEFPYRHSTGETIGRFLAGLKEQKKIWGQRVAGQGVVVPPHGYSEVDGSVGGEWVEVANRGVVIAFAKVHRPIANMHPSNEPFAFVLVKLDGADTALAHFVTQGRDDLTVGSRVEAVWRSDEERVGSLRDFSFRVVEPERGQA
ncbi:MAG: Zn-ribbon domain-containing OB-fold protein, partial [Candidatus Binatia bacterium]